MLGSGQPLSNRLFDRDALTSGDPDTHYHYDANGSLVWDTTYQQGMNPRQRRSLYDGAQRIRTHDYVNFDTEYRYDGLGRMVAQRGDPALYPALHTSFDGPNVGTVTTASEIEVIQTPDAVDRPLVLLTPDPCYFVTNGPRLLAAVTETGSDCVAGNSNWDLYGRHTGAIAESYSFDANRSYSANTQLSAFRNRMYDPRSGRFTQEDPIGFAGGLNLYNYGGNNPAFYTDPFGLLPCLPWCTAAIGGAVFGLVRVSANIIQGRPFGEGVAEDVVRGVAIGGTLGLAAPAVITRGATAVTELPAYSQATLAQVQRQFDAGGSRSLERGIRSHLLNIAEHERLIAQYRAAGGSVSSMEREVRQWQAWVEAARHVLEANR